MVLGGVGVVLGGVELLFVEKILKCVVFQSQNASARLL